VITNVPLEIGMWSVVWGHIITNILTKHHAMKAYWVSGGIAPRIR
jgi:hypothetical protein